MADGAARRDLCRNRCAELPGPAWSGLVGGCPLNKIPLRRARRARQRQSGEGICWPVLVVPRRDDGRSGLLHRRVSLDMFIKEYDDDDVA